MFDYTKEALGLTVTDLKKFVSGCTIVSNVLYIGYLIYALAVGAGSTFLNILLGVVALAYFVIYLFTFRSQSKTVRKIRRAARHYAVWIKIGIKAFTLTIAVYGFYAASTHFTPISVMLTSFMAIIWVGQILVELVCHYVENRINLFKTALDADVEGVSDKVRAVSNVFKRIRGEEIEEKDDTLASSKIRKMLDARVAEAREEKKTEKEQRRVENRANRKARRRRVIGGVLNGIKGLIPKRKMRDVELIEYTEIDESKMLSAASEAEEALLSTPKED